MIWIALWNLFKGTNVSIFNKSACCLHHKNIFMAYLGSIFRVIFHRSICEPCIHNLKNIHVFHEDGESYVFNVNKKKKIDMTYSEANSG